jgi:transposase
MSTTPFLPLPDGLDITSISEVSDVLLVQVTSLRPSSVCPLCAEPSSAIHSFYQRKPMDLPCVGRPIRLLLTVRKFFCREAMCSRKIFTERLPELLEPSSRLTSRLRKVVQEIGFATCGKGGERLCPKLGIAVSDVTLLWSLHLVPIPVVGKVRVVGVDDWCWRRGQRYGTILVDLERHRVIDLLPDRRSETVKIWLEQHPEVEIVSRDRASSYADAARQGAPQAEQVADRFHLIKNVREKLKELLDRKRACLPWKEEKAEDKPVPSLSSLQKDPAQKKPAIILQSRREKASQGKRVSASRATLSANERRRAQSREKRYERYEAVKALHAQGLNQRAIADTLGLSRPTVRSFLREDHFPERRDQPKDRHQGVVAAYLPFLRERWLAGCHNGRQLFREAKDQGYTGSRAQMERVTTEWRQQLPLKRERISPQQASWYFVISQEQLTAEQRQHIQQFCQASPDLALAYALSQDFISLLTQQKAEELSNWFRRAKQSQIAELMSLAKSMQQDSSAIAAACSLPWSQGQVEGQVNRLKCVKRQMYGRAQFDLLRIRFLRAG